MEDEDTRVLGDTTTPLTTGVGANLVTQDTTTTTTLDGVAPTTALVALVSAAAPSTRPALLELPQEVRDKIYRYVFTSTKHDEGVGEQYIVKVNRYQHPAKNTTQEANAALLLTCRLIYGETIRLYYDCSYFSVQNQHTGIAWLSRMANQASRSVGPRFCLGGRWNREYAVYWKSLAHVNGCPPLIRIHVSDGQHVWRPYYASIPGDQAPAGNHQIWN